MYTSPSFEKLMDATGYARRAQQDKLVATLAAPREHPLFAQAGTGVGKSFALLSRAADVGTPGYPAIVATISNGLLGQYVHKDLPVLAQATGSTFIRVLGRSHYACADSQGAKADGVTSAADRHAWLEAHSTADFAVAGELVAEGMHWSYRCPGYPECKANSRISDDNPNPWGGCAAKRARHRARDVDIVLTNFHVLYYNHLLGGILLPGAVETLIDEAHRLPDTIRDLKTVDLGPGAGSAVYTSVPRLAEATEKVVTFATQLDTPWGHKSAWDTERPVNMARSGAQGAFLARYRTDLEDHLATLETMAASGEEVRGIGTTRNLITLATLMETGETLNWTAVHRQDRPGEIVLIPVTAHERTVAEMVEGGALVTGTAGGTLPSRCGNRGVPLIDVGHPFDYKNQVTGWISEVTGVKADNKPGSPNLERRLAEMAEFTDNRAALVLCTSHADVRAVALELQRRGRQAVFVQPTEGGSMAAKETAHAYEAWVDAGNAATLIGTESYATGLDLPGKKLTHLVLWSYFGMVDHVSEKMTRRYRYFVEEQRHTRVVQSIGRLIRSTSDAGEVLVSDNRFWALLKRCDSMLDRHLRDIPWSAYPTPT